MLGDPDGLVVGDALGSPVLGEAEGEPPSKALVSVAEFLLEELSGWGNKDTEKGVGKEMGKGVGKGSVSDTQHAQAVLSCCHAILPRLNAGRKEAFVERLVGVFVASDDAAIAPLMLSELTRGPFFDVLSEEGRVQWLFAIPKLIWAAQGRLGGRREGRGGRTKSAGQKANELVDTW